MDNGTDFTFLGGYDLHEAREICRLLESNGIAFQLEIDDQAIRNMMPFQAALGGTYGTGVMAAIYVAADAIERCYQILEDLGR